MSQTNSSSQQQAAIAIIKARKGRIRMGEAVESGINRRTLLTQGYRHNRTDLPRSVSP